MEVILIPKIKDLTNINSLKLRVAAYIRVSTKSEDQKYSFKSQYNYYDNKIQSNSNWTFTNIYADYGISGTSTKTRIDFNNMIEDARNHKFDLILTKSVSRFARNSLDTIKYVRELKSLGIGIIFEEEHINTLKTDGELLLTVLSTVAQKESENSSSHIKLGKKMAMSRGVILNTNKKFGYNIDKQTGKFTINQKEAIIVKRIFEMYLNGQSSIQIVKELNEEKIKPQRAKKWDSSTIRKMLKNEVYVGDLLQGKTYVTDPIDKHQIINKGVQDKFLVRNHHDAIISREDFDRAQLIALSRHYEKKEEPVNNYKAKVYCGFCGSLCNYHITKNATIFSCYRMFIRKCLESKVINEQMIQHNFMSCIKKLTSNKLKNERTININNLKNKKKKEEAKLNSLLFDKSLMVDDYINKKINAYDFNVRTKMYDERIIKLKNGLVPIEERIENFHKTKKAVNELFSLINKYKNKEQEFNYELFNHIVKYVVIGGKSDGGRKTPHMVKFVFSINEEIKFSENNYILLDFRDDYEYRILQKNKNGKNNWKHQNKNRVIYEIER